MTELTPPGRIAHYRIIEVLGRGAQGNVYLAQDTRLGRRVALKVLPVAGSTERVVARIEREAEALVRLDHPGICTVYDAGRWNGSAYIAMQFVDGRLLREEIGVPPQTRLELDRRLRILERIARALHATHEEGLVHRDVKPGNVMLESGDSPVLLDFGLARDPNESTVTLPGEILGTPFYMSPEQLSGGSQAIDRRTDIFSLGVVTYEVLTGRRPFRAHTFHGVMRQIVESDPDPARREAPGLPEAVDHVLSLALAKDPRDRYPTAQAMADDLARLRRRELVFAGPQGAWPRLRHWVRRRPVAAGVLAVLLAALVIAPWLLMSYERGVQTRLRASHADAEVQRDQALWSAYVANLAAAGSALDHAEGREARRRLAACPEAHRDFAWNYLSNRANVSLGTLLTLPQSVKARACPNGTLLLGTADGHLHRFLPGAPAAAIRSELSMDGRIWNLHVGPRGKRALVLAEGGRAALWDVEQLVPIRRSASKFQGIFAFPSEQACILGTPRGLVIWNAADGGDRRRIQAPGPRGPGVLLPGNRVILGRLRQPLEVLDLSAGRMEQRISTGLHSVEAMAVNHDGSRVLIGGWDGEVLVLDPTAGTIVARHAAGHRMHPTDALYLREPDVFATCGFEGAIRFWNPQDGRALAVLPEYESRVTCLTYDTVRGVLVTSSHAGVIRAWPVLPRSAARVLRDLGHPVYCVRWLDGDDGVLAGVGRHVHELDGAGGETRRVVRGWTRKVRSITTAPDASSWLGISDAEVRRVSGATAETLPGRADIGWALHGRDGRVFTGRRDLLVVQGGERPAIEIRLPRVAGPIDAAHDEAVVVVGAQDELAVVDLATARVVRMLRGAGDFLSRVRCHPSRPLVAAGARDGLIHVWDYESGNLVQTLAGHQAAVDDVDWHPDGKLLVSASRDGSLRLWDLVRGETVLVLRGHMGAVTSVRFSADGARLLSGSRDGTVRLWASSRPARNDAAARERFARRRRARELVDALWVEREFSTTVRTALAEDPSLAPGLRRAAVAETYAREEDPSRLADQAWSILARGTASGDEVRFAQRALAVATSLDGLPESYGVLRSAALLRTGDPKAALDALGRNDEKEWVAVKRAFLVLAHVALGNTAEAEAWWRRSQHALNGSPQVGDPRLQALMAEARDRLEAGR